MQSLSIWPSRWGLITPSPELELGFSSFSSRKYCCCVRNRRTKRLNPCSGSVVQTRSRRTSLGVLFVPSYLCDVGNHGSAQFRFLSGVSKLECNLSGKTKKFSFGTCVALAWALEEQGVPHEFITEFSEKNSSLLKDSNNGNDKCLGLDDNYTDSGLTRSGGKHNAEDTNGNVVTEGGAFVEAKPIRIDVRALGQSLEFVKSPEDIDEVLKDKGGELPLQVCSSMIKTFGRDKKLKPAFVLVEWLKTKSEEIDGFDAPNAFVYNSLLGAIKQSGDFDQVEKVLDDMTQSGISPNVVTYNTLMSVYLEQGKVVEALRLFNDFGNKGLSPSPASYSTALLAYRRMVDGHGALKLFVNVREKYKRGELRKTDGEDWEGEIGKLKSFTSRICYQVMRQWLVREGNSSTAVLKLLMELDQAELTPARAEHERLIWACTREEHYTVVKELYTRIREQESGIRLSVCNHVIWVMGKAKKWWAALEVYEDMLDKGPHPNNLSYELVVSHFNVLLSAARRRGIWRWGIRLIDKMESKGLRPGSREWNAVLVACSKASEATAAVEIFKRMVEQGEKPTVISYGALLSALEKGKLYDEAVRVWEHMLKVGVEPNVYAYTIMASVYAGLGKFKVVDIVIEEMVSTENMPTVVTFNAIISACARNDMGSAAYEWFHRMKVMNILPNEVTYEMLINALAKDGKPKLAYEIYLRALKEGLNLSCKAYDTVVECAETYGATIDASVLGPRPPGKTKNVPVKRSSDLSDVPIGSKA